MDITVKGGAPPGDVLAPTWNMVEDYKSGKLTQWDYTIKYFSLLMSRMSTIGDGWRNSLDLLTLERTQITLVCFCPAGEFCHRILAARMLAEMGHGQYIGEWQI